MDESNGATELWLGTHRDTRGYLQEFGGGTGLDEEVHLAPRRKEHPPIRAILPAGAILMRDWRTWHRGIGNPSPRHRLMLGMVHVPTWIVRGHMTASESARPFFESSDFQHDVVFLD